MSESVRVRLLLAKMPSDTEPSVVAAVDSTIWAEWDDEDEAAWRRDGRATWGLDPSKCEWREVWATFSPADLAAAFSTPDVRGEVE